MLNPVTNQSGKYLAIDGPLAGSTIPLNESLQTMQISVKKTGVRGHYKGSPGGVNGLLLEKFDIHPR